MDPRHTRKGFFGRYRALILTVALSLVSDIAVVSLTLHYAQAAREHAANLVATKRVRELTLELQRQAAEMQILDLRQLGIPDEFVAELEQIAAELGTILAGLDQGGRVTRGDGSIEQLRAIALPDMRQALTNTREQFDGVRSSIDGLRETGAVRDRDAAFLYGYMQRFYYRSEPEVAALASGAQALADSASERLRTTQVVGLLVALGNFLYTMLISMRALARNDARLASARRETDEILENVSDGLLLLDAELRVGATTSARLPDILGRAVHPGDDFLAVLGDLASAETRQASASYLRMLAAGRVRENLVRSLNPLSDVELGAAGSGEARHLSFQFARVLRSDGEFSHLLVTVQDATRRVQLERELASARHKTRAELEVYLRLLGTDAAALRAFVTDTRARCDDINERMRAATDRGHAAYTEIVRVVFQQVHAIKGEALVLGLDFFVDAAQRFEDELQRLRARSDLSGDDFLGLSVRLDELFARLEVLGSIVERLADRGADTSTAAAPVERLVRSLDALAAGTASRRGKRVALMADLRALADWSEARMAPLREVLVQLVRNAITHGIEPPDTRAHRHKRPAGTISIQALPAEAGSIELRVRDDGAGIDPEAIRARLVRAGLRTPEQAAALSHGQLVRALFEPGFSTAEHADEDAGSGVGLDLVQAQLARLGAVARVRTRLNDFTEFAFTLDPAHAPRMLAEASA